MWRDSRALSDHPSRRTDRTGRRARDMVMACSAAALISGRFSLFTWLGGLQAGDVGCRVAHVGEGVAAAHRGLGAEGLVGVGAWVDKEPVAAAADAGAGVARELVVVDHIVVRPVDEQQAALEVCEVSGGRSLPVQRDADRAAGFGVAVA